MIVKVCQRFRGPCCLYHQGDLMMKAARTSETLVNFYQTTRRYNPEDSHVRTHRRENLKSYMFTLISFFGTKYTLLFVWTFFLLVNFISGNVQSYSVLNYTLTDRVLFKVATVKPREIALCRHRLPPPHEHLTLPFPMSDKGN
jgi:hypothetical protein